MAKRTFKMRLNSIQREELSNTVSAAFSEEPQTHAAGVPTMLGAAGYTSINLNISGLEDDVKSREAVKAVLQAAIDVL